MYFPSLLRGQYLWELEESLVPGVLEDVALVFSVYRVGHQTGGLLLCFELAVGTFVLLLIEAEARWMRCATSLLDGSLSWPMTNFT